MEPANQSPSLMGEWLAPNALTLPSDLPFEQWCQIGEQLNLFEQGVQWWIGDWINYGETRYGEKYLQAIEETGRSYDTLTQYAWVAKTWESCTRVQLSWSHHRLLAGQKDRDKWTKLSLENKWSVSELSRQLQGINGATTLISIPQPELEEMKAKQKELEVKLEKANQVIEKLTVNPEPKEPKPSHNRSISKTSVPDSKIERWEKIVNITEAFVDLIMPSLEGEALEIAKVLKAALDEHNAFRGSDV